MSAGLGDWIYWMSPTAAGPQSVTGIGEQGKAVVFMAIGSFGYSAITNFVTANGFVDMNGNQMCVFTQGLDNVTTTKSQSGIATDRCLVIADPSGTGTTLEVQFTGWTTDGFNFNVIKTNGNTTIIMAIYGGDDIQWTKCGTFALPTAANSAFKVTGLGFQPNMALLHSVNAFTAQSYSGAGGQNSIGGMAQSAASPFTQFCSAINIQNGYASGRKPAVTTRTDRVIQRINSATTAALDIDVAGVSLDSDGFTLNVVTAPTTAVLVGYMAFGGPNLQAMAGAFSEPTVTGNWNTPNTPYVPYNTMLVSGGQVANNTLIYSGGSRRGFSVIFNDSNYWNHDADELLSGTSFWSITSQYNYAMEHMTPTSSSNYNYTVQYNPASGLWDVNPYFTWNSLYADGTSRQTFYIGFGNSGLTYTPPPPSQNPPPANWPARSNFHLFA